MAGFWRSVHNAIFIGDRNWAWRRRITIGGAATATACAIHATWFDKDLAHSTMVFTNAVNWFGVCLGAYTAAVVTDAHLSRRAEIDKEEKQWQRQSTETGSSQPSGKGSSEGR